MRGGLLVLDSEGSCFDVKPMYIPRGGRTRLTFSNQVRYTVMCIHTHTHTHTHTTHVVMYTHIIVI